MASRHAASCVQKKRAVIGIGAMALMSAAAATQTRIRDPKLQHASHSEGGMTSGPTGSSIRAMLWGSG
jgi:hypothetical protein